MKTNGKNEYPIELSELCTAVRNLVEEGRFSEAAQTIGEAMERYPHAPHPHNLLGIVLEKTGDHQNAMKHFRVAWVLDGAYLPANHNLNVYGTFFSSGNCAFDESDLPTPGESENKIIYDDMGIGHVVKNPEFKFDGRGIGRTIRR